MNEDIIEGHINFENEVDIERDRYMDEQRRRRAAQDRRSVENSSLKGTMIKFLQHSSARDFLIEESATLRLVKAIHEQELEDVISSVEQGARINFQVCNTVCLMKKFSIME